MSWSRLISNTIRRRRRRKRLSHTRHLIYISWWIIVHPAKKAHMMFNFPRNPDSLTPIDLWGKPIKVDELLDLSTNREYGEECWFVEPLSLLQQLTSLIVVNQHPSPSDYELSIFWNLEYNIAVVWSKNYFKFNTNKSYLTLS